MELASFYASAFVYLASLLIVWYGLQALDFEKLLKPGRVNQARVLYGCLLAALAYGLGSLILAFMYRI